MKFSKSNTTTTAVTLFLMFAMAVSLVALPVANAQTTKETYPFIGALPNPVGVGQDVLLHVGITEALNNADEGWEGLTVTVKRPDGTTKTLGPFRTDATGGTGTVYVPDEPGNYTLQTHFPEQWYNYTTIEWWSGKIVTRSVLYKASDSEELTLVVQEEPIEYHPGHPLPTEYWTRPIDSQLREWYSITGSWPTDPANRFAFGNDDAPDTAHILWTKPLTIGGLAGGELGLVGSGATSVGFGIGDAYEGKWSSRFILAGRLYYAHTGGGMFGGAGIPPVVYHCVDLHTGEELWAKTFLDNQSISFGQLFYFQAWNYQGTFAYLWVTTGGYDWLTGTQLPGTWYAFDAYTGDWMFTITDMPSGTTLRDEKGGLYILQSDLMNGWMALWNMTAFGTFAGTGFYEGGSWGNNVHMQTLNASATSPPSAAIRAQRAWTWNVSIPKGLPGSVQTTIFGDMVVGANLGGYGAAVPTDAVVWGLNLNSSKGTIGGVLFNKSWKAPTDWIEGNQSISWSSWSAEDKVGVLWSKELRQHYGVSLETGELIWGPTPSQYYLDMYEGTQLMTHLIAYGKLYASGVAGIVYCYDVKTGELLWTYEAADPYTEYLFGNNWWLGVPFITDGKIYAGTLEHSPNQPLPRGGPFVCLNATTGELIWRINGAFRQTGWGGPAIIGDSIIATMDTYDQRIYGIGKGPSATTVAASPKVSVHGSSVLVEGTVTDISPGTEEYSRTARFPNGVPAVADENMSDWMLYVYKQFERPADVTGVEVVLEVLDPNNNYYEVGRTTSDANGLFHCAFTPEVPGEYTIIASFAGSGAYYGSFAETAINVEEAPPPTPEPTPTPASVADMYFLPVSIGMIIAIVIVLALLVLLLLRKP
jgi:outer membrane protein assembly factor BamB